MCYIDAISLFTMLFAEIHTTSYFHSWCHHCAYLRETTWFIRESILPGVKVNEYQSREIADNLDDEKKIRRAENPALRQQKQGQTRHLQDSPSGGGRLGSLVKFFCVFYCFLSAIHIPALSWQICMASTIAQWRVLQLFFHRTLGYKLTKTNKSQSQC